MWNLEEPFAAENLDRVFKIHPDHKDRLKTRESHRIEFKSNFHLGRELDRYARTMAAYANTMGGYLVFGVGNKPRELIGMKDKRFVDLDPEKLTNLLNNRFSPEIEWDWETHRIGGLEFGLIYVFEGKSKPIVALSDGGDAIRQGDIYYRYRGRTERIKYPELRKIIEEERRNLNALWMSHVQRISRIGVDNAAILDLEDGTVTGKAGTFIIDEKLLPQLKFIKEGEFKEVTGSPAIKIVGSAEVLAAGKVEGQKIIEKPHFLHETDIIKCFLEQKEVPNPIEHVEEICFGNSAYLPIYFFIAQSKMSVTRVIKRIRDLKNCYRGSQSRLLDRLEGDDERIHHTIPDTDTDSALARRNFKKQIANKTFRGIKDKSELKDVLLAIQTLEKKEIHVNYLFPRMLEWFNQFWEELRIEKTYFRKAICHIDYMLFKKEARRRNPIIP